MNELILLGPIIRISPYELHIDEPDYYEELYSTNKPRNKYKFLVAQYGLPDTSFATIDWKFHRSRRAAMSPFFSKQSVNRLEPMLSHMVEKLCKRIEEYRASGQPLLIRQAYMCLTTDIITLYALNRSWGFLDSPDLSPLWVETMKAVVKTGALVKYFPFLMVLMEALPIRVIERMDAGMGLLLRFREVSLINIPYLIEYSLTNSMGYQKVQQDTQDVIDGRYKYSQEQTDLGMDKTIIHELLESNLPPEEKLHSRLWQEAQVVIGAGADTTATTLNVTHFHVLDNPDVLKKLRAELETAMPDKFAPAKLSIVERLPYLVS